MPTVVQLRDLRQMLAQLGASMSHSQDLPATDIPWPDWLIEGLRARAQAPGSAPDRLERPVWCKVELFGHSVIYGRLTGVTVADTPMVEIAEFRGDATEPSFPPIVSAKAIFRLTPLDEGLVRHLANEHPYEPVQSWDLPREAQDKIATCTAAQAEMMLGLVLGEQEMPTVEQLSTLSGEELREVELWAGDLHLEASDNDVTASAAPECLRKILPEEHYLHTWRVAEPGGIETIKAVPIDMGVFGGPLRHSDGSPIPADCGCDECAVAF